MKYLWFMALGTAGLANADTVTLDVNLFGRLDGNKVTTCNADNGSNNSCGSTAVVNSLVYLQNQYKTIYGTDLVGTTQQDLIQAADELNCYMGCNGNAGGVPFDPVTQDDMVITGFYQGKQNYIESKVDGVTAYSSMYFNRPNGTPGKGFPTYDFLFQALTQRADVELKIDFYKQSGNDLTPVSAHYVTLYSLTFENDGTGKISFIDPDGGVLQKDIATTFADGSIRETDYIPKFPKDNGATIAFITAAATENVIPEPASGTLICAGVIAAAAAQFARQRLRKE